MTKSTTIPLLGEVLRATIKAAGLRHQIDSLGLGKDLDDLAVEARPGATYRLIQMIEDECAKAFLDDCGSLWAQLFRMASEHARGTLQRLNQAVTLDLLPAMEGDALYERLVSVPTLAGYLACCRREISGPEIQAWWVSPFKAWVGLASRVGNMPSEVVELNLANHVDADPRTLERWTVGEPIAKINWPYRQVVAAALGEKLTKQLGEYELCRLTGWLMVAVAFQSLPRSTRDAVRREFSVQPQMPRSLDDAVEIINQRTVAHTASALRSAALTILERIERLFAMEQRDLVAIREQLNAFASDVVAREQSVALVRSYQCWRAMKTTQF